MPDTPLPPALAAALRHVEEVFRGMTASPEGCLHCYGAEELALLATPGVRLDDDLLRMMCHEAPGILGDHPAVMRRLLPQFLAFVASGRFDSAGYQPTGLGRTAWWKWPPEQAGAVDAFLSVWWAETLATPVPDPDVQTVFQLCADMRQSVTPMLDHWAAARSADTQERHLAVWVDRWIDDLLSDYGTSLFSWIPDPLVEIRTWLLRHASHLDPRVPLLALPYDERWLVYDETVAAAGSARAAETS
ncbi:hypothetical protein [Streptomyces sp. NPDC101115]|uniref:hypothetical protein n=1 Tax=Streptomyces sp. NPDC101115 TaxID=3366106 RepID=UPI0038080DB5